MRRILSFRDFDWALLLMVLALCGISLIEVHSATLHTRFASFERKQMLLDRRRLVAMFILRRSTITGCSTGLPGPMAFFCWRWRRC